MYVCFPRAVFTFKLTSVYMTPVPVFFIQYCCLGVEFAPGDIQHRVLSFYFHKSKSETVTELNLLMSDVIY